MDFKFNGNVFKQTIDDVKKYLGDKFDPNKEYPALTGTLSIPKGQLKDLVEYLHWSLRTTELKHDEYINDYVVPVRVSGWQKTSKAGKKFLSLSFTPDYKTKLAAKEQKEAAATPEPAIQTQQDPAALNVAAASLASATGGQEVQVEDDIFG